MATSIIRDCTDHPHCTVHVYGDFPNEPGSWASHFDDDVDPAARIPLDHPEVVQDRRRGRSANAKVTPRSPTAGEVSRLRSGNSQAPREGPN